MTKIVSFLICSSVLGLTLGSRLVKIKTVNKSSLCSQNNFFIDEKVQPKEYKEKKELFNRYEQLCTSSKQKCMVNDSNVLAFHLSKECTGQSYLYSSKPLNLDCFAYEISISYVGVNSEKYETINYLFKQSSFKMLLKFQYYTTYEIFITALGGRRSKLTGFYPSKCHADIKCKGLIKWDEKCEYSTGTKDLFLYEYCQQTGFDINATIAILSNKTCPTEKTEVEFPNRYKLMIATAVVIVIAIGGIFILFLRKRKILMLLDVKSSDY